MQINKFVLKSDFKPKGDQPSAIKSLCKNLIDSDYQVLLGATGTGKTFTIANVIEKYNKPTLVIAHNKTLVAQLYEELKKLFPDNAVEYFVSFFDFYQPEAYLPSTSTYIEKNAITNREIEMMRLSSFQSIATRKDVIIVASVASIYPSSKKEDIENFGIKFAIGKKKTIDNIKISLIKIGYEFNKIDLSPGCFRSKGDVLEIAPGYTNEYIIRISFYGDIIEDISELDVLNGNVRRKWNSFLLGPASEYYVTSNFDLDRAISNIKKELENRVKFFEKNNKLIEADRIKNRTLYDMEQLKEFGFCQGIENYAMHLEFRKPGETPHTIFDWLGDDWLLIVDESHITIPQIKAMYNTDVSRKTNLVDYGFRLPSALDNRPLTFQEFQKKIKKAIFVSATPNEWEIKISKNVVEQIVRPTGLLDPIISVRSSVGQMDNLIEELKKQKRNNERTLITVMTIKMAEGLSEFLKDKGIKTAYLHNELKTLERMKVITDLRKGKYDCVVGINLLREGLDIPEVSLVAIFDADKPGFFRSEQSLIQIIGRAARNKKSRVIMYADSRTPAMEKAIDETNRRRNIQIKYNKENNILPQSIKKPIIDSLNSNLDVSELESFFNSRVRSKNKQKKLHDKLYAEMNKAALDKDYERAAELRDILVELGTLKYKRK